MLTNINKDVYKLPTKFVSMVTNAGRNTYKSCTEKVLTLIIKVNYTLLWCMNQLVA